MPNKYKKLKEWPRGLKYCPKSGNFLMGGEKPRLCLAKNANGYRYIYLFLHGNIFLHRLAFMAVTGKMPGASVQVDHINGIRTDNRFSNLRLVGARDNQGNMKKHRAGKLIGAVFCKHNKVYRPRIQYKGRSISLGYFKTAEEAHRAYLDAKRKFEHDK